MTGIAGYQPKMVCWGHRIHKGVCSYNTYSWPRDRRRVVKFLRFLKKGKDQSSALVSPCMLFSLENHCMYNHNPNIAFKFRIIFYHDVHLWWVISRIVSTWILGWECFCCWLSLAPVNGFFFSYWGER